MFEDLIKEIESLKRLKSISIPVLSDQEGYLDKKCPSEECKYQFKVFEEDWSNMFGDNLVFCPFCGHNESKDSFWNPEQVEEAKKQAFNYIQGKVNKALIQGAQKFNQRQPRNAFIRMSMSVKGASPQSVILPISAQKELELKLQCEKCNCRYAVIGSAFFCPCCGYNSVDKTFEDSIIKVFAKIKNLDLIRKAVSEISRDEAEITCRSLIETGLSDCVVAFQRFCEFTYRKHPNAKEKIPSNAFQKLDVGDELWKDVFNEGYETWLTSDEFERMNLLFQRRHLLAHCEGIVDKKYLEKSKDTSYKEGQRIVVKEKDVLYLSNIIKKIVLRIRNKFTP